MAEMETEIETTANVMLKCEMCELEILSNGEKRNENPLCEHKMVTASVPTPVIDSNPFIINPEWDEMVVFKQMKSTLQDVRKYIIKYENDLRVLNETYTNCNNKLQQECENLCNKIEERTNELSNQIEYEYNKRQEKIINYLNELKEYEKQNINCHKQCQKRILETVNVNNNEEQLLKRVKYNVSECNNSYKLKPKLYEIPIKLEFEFERYHNKLVRDINIYGRLDGKDVNVEPGKSLKQLYYTKYIAPSKPIETTTKSDAILIKYENFLPIIKRANLKDNNQSSLILTFAPRDPKIDDNNNTYNKLKNENLFLHIQCKNETKEDEKADWGNNKNDSVTVDSYFFSPKSNAKGKYEIDLTQYKNLFKLNGNIFVRLRYEYLSNIICVENGNFVGKDNDLLAVGNWFESVKPLCLNGVIDIPIPTLPERVKVKAKVSGKNGKDVTKSWTLKQQANDYCLDALHKLAARSLKLENDCSFEITVDSANGDIIENDSDVLKYIVNGVKDSNDIFNAIISVKEI